MAAVFHSRPFLIAFLSFLATCSTVAQEPASVSGEGLLELNSGDFLRGSVQSLEYDGKLTWKHTLTDQEIRYNTEGIRQILFKRNTNSSENSDIVWLSTEDRFVCRVQSITKNEVIVDSTVFDQPLRFKRSDVAGVTLRDSTGRDDTILGGSMNAADWDVPGRQTNSSKVTFNDGKMVIGGSFWPTISRKAKFPDAFIIDTEIDWKDALRIIFQIGASDHHEDDDAPKVSLTLDVQAETIRMQRVILSEGGKRKSYSTLTSVREINKFTDGLRSIRLQAYINVLNGDCSLYINKKFAGKSDGPLISEALNGTHVLGSGIQINHKSPSPMRIRSFTIHQWDGRSLPSKPHLRKADSDHIYFEDGDNTKGKIIGLEVSGDERLLTAEIPYSEKSPVSIPAPFLDYFTFGNNKQFITSDKSKISAHLTDGSILHLSRLKSAEGSTLEGELIGGYKINLPSESLARLSFEMNNPQENDDE